MSQQRIIMTGLVLLAVVASAHALPPTSAAENLTSEWVLGTVTWPSGDEAWTDLAHAYTACALEDMEMEIPWQSEGGTGTVAAQILHGQQVLDTAEAELQAGRGTMKLGTPLPATVTLLQVDVEIRDEIGQALRSTTSFIHVGCLLQAPLDSLAANRSDYAPMTLAQATLLKCDPNLGNELAIHDEDNLLGRHGNICRALNSELGICEENGDCECGSQPFIPGVTDTDRDGVPNSQDIDDDCDHLTDTLEDRVGFSTTTPTNVLDMNPSGFQMKVRAGIKGLSGVADWDDFKVGHADPYASDVVLSVSAPNAEDARFSFPKFKKSDHPSNIGSSFTFPDHGSLAGWSEATQPTVLFLPDKIDDLDFTWRSANDVRGLPQFQLRFSVLDADSNGAAEKMLDVDTGAFPALNLLQLAGKVGGDFHPTTLLYGSTAAGVKISLDFGVEASPCAVAWAYEAFINDVYAIGPGTGIVPSSVSTSTC